jgi:hypothetical protein
VHDFPKRAHLWHRLTEWGVHLALAAVHATHALLLTGDTMASMMSRKGGTERPVDVGMGVAVRPGKPDHPVGTVCNPPKKYI